MLISIHVPILGTQDIYERLVDSLCKQGTEDFELIVCNDAFNCEPLRFINTKFKHKLVRLFRDKPGWGYPCARNACLDYASRDADYLLYLDADWVLTPFSLINVSAILDKLTIVQGFKQYRNDPSIPEKKRGKVRLYPEFAIFPFSVFLTAQGLDEIFFPHYAGYWHDLMRRIDLTSHPMISSSRFLFANDVGTNIVFNRDPNDGGFLIAEDLKNKNTLFPVLRGIFRSELVWETGY